MSRLDVVCNPILRKSIREWIKPANADLQHAKSNDIDSKPLNSCCAKTSGVQPVKGSPGRQSKDTTCRLAFIDLPVPCASDQLLAYNSKNPHSTQRSATIGMQALPFTLTLPIQFLSGGPSYQLLAWTEPYPTSGINPGCSSPAHFKQGIEWLPIFSRQVELREMSAIYASISRLNFSKLFISSRLRKIDFHVELHRLRSSLSILPSSDFPTEYCAMKYVLSTIIALSLSGTLVSGALAYDNPATGGGSIGGAHPEKFNQGPGSLPSHRIPGTNQRRCPAYYYLDRYSRRCYRRL